MQATYGLAAIQRCLRSRKLQRVGKFFFVVTLLGYSIGYYVLNFSKKQARGKLDVGNYSLTLAESTVNGTLPVKPIATALNIHIWRELCGSDMLNLRKSLFFPHYPDESVKSLITEFHIEDDSWDYGQLIFGFVHPPSSASYRLAIVSDDTSELWLSSNEDPSDKILVARVFTEGAAAWAKVNQLHKYPDQISKDLNLRKGSKYYFEVLHKQGAGEGFVQVFWKRSQDKDFKLISSEYLSPYSKDILLTAKNKDVLHRVLSGRHRHELEQKSKRISKEYLKFYSLPLIPKESYLPSCSYKSSYVLSSRIYQYEGIDYVAASMVYPEDDTAMGSGYWETWPNRVADKELIQAVAEKITNSLRLKTSK